MRINKNKFPALYDSDLTLLGADQLSGEDLKAARAAAQLVSYDLQKASRYIVSDWVLRHISKPRFAAKYLKILTRDLIREQSCIYMHKSGNIETVHIYHHKGEITIVISAIKGTDIFGVQMGILQFTEDGPGFKTPHWAHESAHKNLLNCLLITIFKDYADLERIELKAGDKGKARKKKSINGQRIFNEDGIDAIHLDARWVREYEGEVNVEPFPRMQAIGKGWSDRKLVIVSGHKRNYKTKSGREKATKQST